jgi:chemotaxis protein methyltransferase CheR
VLVRALANQGRVADAGEVCAQALDRHSTSGELRYLLSLVLAEDGRHREAVVAARQALYLEPTLVVGHLVLGNSLARLGDHRGARLAFRNADRLLAKLEPDATVPASDGEPAGRLAQLVRMRLHLLKRGA